MEVCPPFSDIALGLRGPASECIRGIRDTGAFIQSTISLQGSRIRSQTWPWDPQKWVFRPPSTATLLPRHTRQGGCPQWSWGSDLRGGLHGSPAVPVSRPPPHREERGGCCWRRAYLSAQYILSQLWETMHVSTKLPTRERRPPITPTLASSACDFNSKTNHSPTTCLPVLLTLMLPERSFTA